MLRTTLLLCGAVFLTEIATAFRGSLRDPAIRLFLIADSCTIERLGRAAAADTSRLRRVKLESAPSESAEGGETTAYYDGDQPRVIVTNYFGETGRAVVRYYLASRDQYVVQREELRYAEPISVQSHPVVSVRIPSTLYVCGRSSKSPLASDDVAHIRSDLDSTLAQLHKSH
jgi:hypothetical protein